MAAVLDASAVLALLNREPGQDVVEAAVIAGATICTVNLTEVITLLLRDRVPEATIRQTLEQLPIGTVDFDNDLALAAGMMSDVTHRLGRSLGDHACLALACRQNEPALTAARSWAPAGPLVRVSVKLIR